MTNFQKGSRFEDMAIEFFRLKHLILKKKQILCIGIGKRKKKHSFDLGNSKRKVIVECKSHEWTEGNHVPSAKMTIWNEAMYYFSCCPKEYRKIFFVKKSCHPIRRNNGQKQSLAQYYLEKYGHMVPKDVEIWEYDYETSTASKILTC